MHRYLSLLLVLLAFAANAQQHTGNIPANYRHFELPFQDDNVQVLVKSAPGEELKPKPLFLFCQGSLPVPLFFRWNDGSIHDAFVFNTDSLTRDYHLVIIGKPFIPVMSEQSALQSDLTYVDSTGRFPLAYDLHNRLDYYVARNKFVVRYLLKQSWADKRGVVLAGHSEGSTVAAKLATELPETEALIYAAGNPMGRMMTIVARERAKDTDSSSAVDDSFNYWKQVIADSSEMVKLQGDMTKTMYQFSRPPMRYLLKLKVPVLVYYGSKDAGALFNDYFHLECIRLGLKNFSFRALPGTEHNFFPLKADGTVNYDVFNWDKVVSEWRAWLSK
ncbi:S9 family peptidase [Chitinophaga sp. Cy-1792]|uniref:alpha/beta hydrolase family protein n=1 Tax=Chitinophaga sp. Cy-1792 TaxID=2608339 RepID=UPI001420068A|nr:hypothetical protein [Chitinophaga sp. Cy-1792]NIG54133.1 hypothetical protein [Chitinophaga sp. Cy-1792]